MQPYDEHKQETFGTSADAAQTHAAALDALRAARTYVLVANIDGAKVPPGAIPASAPADQAESGDVTVILSGTHALNPVDTLRLASALNAAERSLVDNVLAISEAIDAARADDEGAEPDD